MTNNEISNDETNAGNPVTPVLRYTEEPGHFHKRQSNATESLILPPPNCPSFRSLKKAKKGVQSQTKIQAVSHCLSAVATFLLESADDELCIDEHS
jgi:hypothetical protein